MTSRPVVAVDKDPERLSGDDALAHRVFLSLETRRRVASAIIDEPIAIASADPSWRDWFVAEAALARRAGSARSGAIPLPILEAQTARQRDAALHEGDVGGRLARLPPTFVLFIRKS